jgi:hypothetical protein
MTPVNEVAVSPHPGFALECLIARQDFEADAGATLRIEQRARDRQHRI